MASPRVSVLLPVRDAATTLSSALRSVQRQTLHDWECIVVDDGSRDGSRELARRASVEDGRIRLIERPRRGLVAALDAGLAACRGGVVARMDADDAMHRERLAVQLAALDAAPRLSAVGCHVRLFPRRGLGDGMRRYERWLNAIDSSSRVREEAFVECPIAHPSLAIRAGPLRAAGYRDCDWPEDYDLVLRLLAGGAEIGVVPRRLLAWRHGASRLSRTDPRYSLERFTACKAAFLAQGLLAGGEGYVLWGYGETGRALARALRQHDRRVAAIVEVHPRRIGQRIQGAPVVAPEGLAGWRGTPLVVSVSGEQARSLIRAELARQGLRETVDYVCAA